MPPAEPTAKVTPWKSGALNSIYSGHEPRPDIAKIRLHTSSPEKCIAQWVTSAGESA